MKALSLIFLFILQACSTSSRKENSVTSANEFPQIQTLIDIATSSKRIPGAVVLVEHKGKLSIYTSGISDLKNQKPMRTDAIFRITSMTKPVVAAATLVLVNEKKIKLSDPIRNYLPEFKNLWVLKHLNSPLNETVALKRAPTVRDLLTLTWGNGMLYFEPDQKGPTYPIHVAMKNQGLLTAPPLPPVEISPNEWTRRLAQLPLMHQPGERWIYNNGIDVLGVLLARVTNTSLPDLLEQKIFKPLGMTDTGFFVPEEKWARFQPAYAIDMQNRTVHESDPLRGYYSKSPAFPSGSAGLTSTAADYLKFAKMLMNEGTLGDVQLLPPALVHEMTTDHIPQKVKDVSNFFPNFWKTTGWGYGLSVQTKPNGVIDYPGTYGWSGGFGTDWFNDPRGQVIGIVMTQLSIDFDFFTDVRKSIYSNLQ